MLSTRYTQRLWPTPGPDCNIFAMLARRVTPTPHGSIKQVADNSFAFGTGMAFG
jgi:hypothetical protein